jgi:hypothetical protein
VTEAEWLACTAPEQMLGFLRGKASDRKLRLFACACSRRCEKSSYEENRLTIEAVELFADCKATSEALRARRMGTASWLCYAADSNALVSALKMLKFRTEEEGWKGCKELCGPGHRNHLWSAERGVLCGALRDIFGNPFRPPHPLPPAVLRWHDDTVPRLAQTVYEERRMPEGTLDSARLAVLADALLDAGCEDEALIQHCREPGTHVRGCWAVDHLLGKR